MLLVRSASRTLASGIPSACSRRGSITTLYCLTNPPTLATSATPSAFGDAVADIPVLDGTQLGEALLRARTTYW